MRIASISLTILLLNIAIPNAGCKPASGPASIPAVATETDLYAAIEKDDAAKLAIILDAKPELLEPKDKEKAVTTPLVAAIRGKKEKSVDLLLTRGADENRRADSLTPLMWAVLYEHIPILDRLAKVRPNFSLQDTRGRTVFHYAAAFATKEGMQTLRNYSMAVDVRDRIGRSALHLLLMRADDPEICAAFLDRVHGDDLFGADQFGWTEKHFAAAFHSQYELINMFNALNVKTKTGKTPLHLACSNGDVKLIEHLVGYGADIHAADNRGWQAVDYFKNGSIGNIENKLLGRNSLKEDDISILKKLCKSKDRPETAIHIKNIVRTIDASCGLIMYEMPEFILWSDGVCLFRPRETNAPGDSRRISYLKPDEIKFLVSEIEETGVLTYDSLYSNAAIGSYEILEDSELSIHSESSDGGKVSFSLTLRGPFLMASRDPWQRLDPKLELDIFEFRRSLNFVHDLAAATVFHRSTEAWKILGEDTEFRGETIRK
ncbi:MAG: ankyrin repeat domain-containing protein [Planctomycetota bacterium]